MVVRAVGNVRAGERVSLEDLGEGGPCTAAEVMAGGMAPPVTGGLRG
jgi:hypothetical protein